MKRGITKRSGYAVIVTALLAQPVLAGVVFEIETTDHGSSEPYTSQVMVEGQNLKMNIHGGRDGAMIFRGDRREMIVVNDQDKSYMVIDQKTMEQIGGQVNQAMQQMQEALKNVPEKQRAMMEKMMKQRMGTLGDTAKRPSTEVHRTGERGTKAGYPCVKYQVLRAGKTVRELWVTDWDNLEGSQEAIDAFKEMAAFFKQMMDSIDVGRAPFGEFDNPFEQMDQFGGFPVVSRELDGRGQVTGESTLRSAKRQTLDPAAFEPPSGYKRQSMGPR